MSVSFYGTNHRNMQVTAFGAHPVVVHLHDDADADFADTRSMNLANDNSLALFRLLGLHVDDDLCGEAAIPEIRRAIMKARATFERRAPEFTRSEEVTYGKPRVNDSGVVELRSVRAVVFGVDQDYLDRQLDRLSTLVEALAAKGATHLAWA